MLLALALGLGRLLGGALDLRLLPLLVKELALENLTELEELGPRGAGAPLSVRGAIEGRLLGTRCLPASPIDVPRALLLGGAESSVGGAVLLVKRQQWASVGS